MNNKFTWIDLTTFNVESAKQFYQTIFGWQYAKDTSDDYLLCSKANTHCAALYTMPDFFQKINMPSFWMSYVSVQNIEEVVEKAKTLGGKVELEQQNEWGKIALIRDPSGAGFTCYEGGDLQVAPNRNLHGRWYHNELFVSDIALVKAFYENVFSWHISIKDKANSHYQITNAANEAIATIQVAANDTKGDKEFWGVYFVVDDLKSTRHLAEKMGGTLVYDHNNTEGNHLLMHDNQGAAFFLSESRHGKQDNQPSTTKSTSFVNSLKWKSIVGLLVLYLVMLTGQQWGYGVFWLLWVGIDIKRGSTYFFDAIDKDTNPLFYWVIIFTWLIIAAYYLIQI